MAAESCRAAVARWHAAPCSCGQQDGSVSRPMKLIAARTDDVGHLEGGPVHLLISLRERFTWSG